MRGNRGWRQGRERETDRKREKDLHLVADHPRN